MTMKRRTTAAIAALAVLGVLGHLVLTRPAAEPTRPANQPPPGAEEPRFARKDAERPRRSIAPQAVARPLEEAPVAPPALPSTDEEELMQTLRHSWTTDPLGTIERVKLLEARFPDSPHAPERSWLVVRALVDLRRFQEARDEAELMVARFPHNSWAGDVQRHLLVHPLGLASREEQQEAL